MEHLELADRVTKLERSVRRHQRVAVALGLALSALALLAARSQQEASQQDLTVRTLVAQDVVIGSADTTGSLRLIGRCNLRTVAMFDSGGVVINGADGSQSVLIGSSLHMMDGPYNVSIAANKDRKSAGITMDGPGIPGQSQEFPTRLFSDAKGDNPKVSRSTRVILEADGREGTSLKIADSQARVRAHIGAQVTEAKTGGRSTSWPESTITLWDEAGSSVFWAPQNRR